METYNAYCTAAKHLAALGMEINREDGPGFTSPAWTLVYHAQRHCERQAETALRGE